MSAAGTATEDDKKPDQGGAHINLKVKGQYSYVYVAGLAEPAGRRQSPPSSVGYCRAKS
ncbi:Small ubiquitin-related modifier 1 [Platanthera zijinensis]|uniref:Small ubiquitin-related modifier 1 n=1 Tax=Platanthera zijinensis TaxID=2320716 RepID=A0AAP0G9H8_9ASPA